VQKRNADMHLMRYLKFLTLTHQKEQRDKTTTNTELNQLKETRWQEKLQKDSNKQQTHNLVL
jgi:hypothetical protein